MNRLIIRGVVRLFVVIILIFVLQNCNKDVEQPVTDVSDYDYFPIYKGLMWIDSVSDINIDVKSLVYDTVVYLQRTVIDSVVPLSKYDKKAFCTKYIYDNDIGKWVLNNRFWFEKTSNKLIEYKDNYPMVELIFPLNVNSSWNRFAYNVNSDTLLLSVVEKHDVPLIIDSVFYDSVTVICHNLDSTLIYKYLEKSYYAKKIGMVKYKYLEIISDDPNFDYTLPIEQRIKTAHIITINRLY